MKIKENNEGNTVDFTKLDPGDCFRYTYGEKSDLYIKSDHSQDATRLSDGHMLINMYGDMVTPVNAEVQIID